MSLGNLTGHRTQVEFFSHSRFGIVSGLHLPPVSESSLTGRVDREVQSCVVIRLNQDMLSSSTYLTSNGVLILTFNSEVRNA